MRSTKRPWWVLYSPVLLLLLAWLYWQKPDFAAALTIFPAWTWVPAGLLPLLAWKRLGMRLALSVTAAWCAYALLFSEEWVSLKRFTSIKSSRSDIRIVSLNCAGGSIEAASEVGAFNPDIVLLQESPGKHELEVLAKELFGEAGSAHVGVDGSILSRWPMTAVAIPRRTIDFVAAVVTPPDSSPINVISLRLMPPSFRVDLISPSAWTEVAQNRRYRREELREIVQFVQAMPDRPTIIGGDFNAQSGDAVYRVMPANMKDAFYKAGSGWCHTAVNETALARIDQIWLSDDFEPQVQQVFKTIHSDHRMVVLDAARLRIED